MAAATAATAQLCSPQASVCSVLCVPDVFNVMRWDETSRDVWNYVVYNYNLRTRDLYSWDKMLIAHTQR